MNRLPSGYEVSLSGDRKTLSGPGPVYRTVQKDVEPSLMYRRRPVAGWEGGAPQETIFFIARLDEISRRSVGMERIKALSQLAKVFREWGSE